MPGIIKRRKGAQPKRRLREIGAAIPPVATKSLLLLHITPVGAAQEIVDSGQIETRHCKVFSRKLTYFFVFRPAYRLRNGDEKSDQISRFPVVFIVSPDDLGDPFHVYPFDTGGAESGVFDERADEWVFLEDYELEPTLTAVRRHITWGFGSVEAYFDGELKPDLMQSLKQWDIVPRSFVDIARLAASGANEQPDRRASAIEVAYSRHVPLKGHVKLVILPKQYLEDATSKNTAFMKKLKAAKVDWVPYDWQPSTTPDEYRDEISRIAWKYFSRPGVL